MEYRKVNRRMFRTGFSCVVVWVYQGVSGKVRVSVKESLVWKAVVKAAREAARQAKLSKDAVFYSAMSVHGCRAWTVMGHSKCVGGKVKHDERFCSQVAGTRYFTMVCHGTRVSSEFLTWL